MVFEKVREILCDQLDLEEDKVTMDSDIVEDFEADSLDVVDLVMSLEDEFGIEIPDEEIENIKTVGDVVRYIEAVSYTHLIALVFICMPLEYPGAKYRSAIRFSRTDIAGAHP